MAELPELEILRREADKDLSNRKIKTIDITVAGAIKKAGPKKQLLERFEGMKNTGVSRVGESLVLKLDSGDALLVVLGNTGRMVRAQTKDAVPKGLVATLPFTQHGGLRIIDPAKHSQLLVVAQDDVAATAALGGFDLADEPVSWTAFGERLLRRTEKIKTIMMDSAFLVGIGPIYSDEVLFECGLRADRTPQTLTPQEIRRLYRAIVEIVHEAMKHGGTTVGPDGWTNLSGGTGGYGQFLAVHGREGLMTPRARGPVVKAKFGSGVTYYCEATQM